MIVADAVLIIGYVVSALVPDRRLWPIGDSRWRWWFNWSVLSIVFTGFLVLAYRDWDSFRVSSTPLRIGGALLSVLGMVFSLSALFELGWMESSGREETFSPMASTNILGIHKASDLSPSLSGRFLWQTHGN